MTWLQQQFGVGDEGGWLLPNRGALNLSGRPELLLSPEQTAAAATAPAFGRNAPLVSIGAIYGMNPDDVATKIEAKQRLAVMRYGGRPY